METVWFLIVAAMITAYVLLDGFDLGAGAIYLWVARSNAERRAVLRSIGPVWDGNEVWLLAAGGALYSSFPLLYASSFSGFYLPLMIVLWLLMLRAISIEFRSHIGGPVWSNFFDVVFCASSALLAVFLGAALGNVIRGVPLGPDGYFFEPLWTTFGISTHPGILDWYTVLAGGLALTALATHGALYVAVKTEGPLNQRSRRVVTLLLPLQFVLTAVSLFATTQVRPALLGNYRGFPPGFLLPLLAFAALGLAYWANRQRQEKLAFSGSCAYLASVLVGAAFALYPVVLPATTDPALSLTIFNTAAGHHGLSVALVWWVIGMALALAYFFFVYRKFAGKVLIESLPIEPEGQGH
jgi:cytochrome d ubiquinol oxidase subunit II